MTKPVLRRCPDGYFRRVIYDLASFIADYSEQVLLTGIVSGWCPKYVAFSFMSCGINTYLNYNGRCTTLATDLDAHSAGCRTRELYEALMEEFAGEGGILWDNYGMDEEITVRTYFSLRLFRDFNR